MERLPIFYVSCSYAAPIGRLDYSDFLRGLDLSVYAYGDSNDPITLGRYAADHLLVSDAELEGWSLDDVCDQDSYELYSLFWSIFNRDEEALPEFEIDEPVEHVIYLRRSILHPMIRPYEAGILQVIGELFGNFTVLVMQREVSTLSDYDLTGAGFAKIGGENLVFRHMALRTEFTEENPQGLDVDLDPTDADGKWLAERWRREGAKVERE